MSRIMPWVRRTLIVFLTIVVLATGAIAAEIQRVNVTPSGAQSSAGAAFSSISGDGTRVAFTTRASDLVSPATNGTRQVFLRDYTTGKTTLVSVSSKEEPAAGDNDLGQISADGRFVVFASAASNLVSDDNNAAIDIFRRDLSTGNTVLISKRTDDTQAAGTSSIPVVSADGNKVAFVSSAANLAGTDTNNVEDVFLRDVAAGTTTLVSGSGGSSGNAVSGGVLGGGDVGGVAISGDGSKVAFGSRATNLASDSNGASVDIFLWSGGSITLESSGPSGQGNFDSIHPTLSGDGSHLGFWSTSTNLDPDDKNCCGDIFVKNLGNSSIELADLDNQGNQDNGVRAQLGQSLDQTGSKIVFTSVQALAEPACTGNQEQIYVRDLAADTTTMISVAMDGQCGGDRYSSYGAISADGNSVTFSSAASNLVSGDTNNDSDVFRFGADPCETDPDAICGSSGDDNIEGTEESETIYAGEGNDTIDGGGGNDVIVAGGGNDVISGAAGDDKIDGGPGNDAIVGDSPPQQPQSGSPAFLEPFLQEEVPPGNDVLAGGDGDDALDGNGGNDQLNGGAGIDSVLGSDGNDTVAGAAANDSVVGGPGADQVLGQGGNDKLQGNEGPDTLKGGPGVNDFDGGPGTDVCVLNNERDRTRSCEKKKRNFKRNFLPAKYLRAADGN